MNKRSKRVGILRTTPAAAFDKQNYPLHFEMILIKKEIKLHTMLLALCVLYSLTSSSRTINLGEIFTDVDNVNGFTFLHLQYLFADVNVLKQQMANLVSSNALLENTVATLQAQLIGSSNAISQ
jgi:hypothetical protein